MSDKTLIFKGMKILLLGLLTVLMSCVFLNNSETSMSAPVTSNTCIKYASQFVPNPEFVNDGEYQFSDLLYLEILRCNVPIEKTIWLSGKQSRTEFTSNDWEYIGKSLELKWQDENGLRVAAGKEFPDFSWYHEFNPPIASSGEFSPNEFYALDGRKQIADYDCQQGRIKTANGSFELYYCPDFSVDDETQAIPGWPEVPGLVMEVHRTADKFQGPYLELTRVTNVQIGIEETGLYKMPSNFTLLTPDQARALQKEKIQARPAELAAASKYLGSWYLNNDKDKIELEITETAEELILSSNNLSSTHQTIPRTETLRGTLYERGIWVDASPGHRLYVLNEAGELIWEARPAFRYTREN